ncbi:hypothetical protein EI77_02245 [Prosthecobacter fusiformis]|uniref:Uncharacterized protein n=1 Tax=Prosthecobacter fusiformis TaxID=48464 RepID=A0A4R7S0Y9_9BACT|nr:hypothetical protein EI77_02245 [Prosthecobacter fusiformis]
MNEIGVKIGKVWKEFYGSLAGSSSHISLAIRADHSRGVGF